MSYLTKDANPLCGKLNAFIDNSQIYYHIFQKRVQTVLRQGVTKHCLKA